MKTIGGLIYSSIAIILGIFVIAYTDWKIIGIVAIAVNSSVYTFNELLPLEYRPLNFIEAYPMVVFGGFGVGLFGCFKVLATGEITIAAGASIFSTFTLGDNVGWNALSITYIVQ